MKWEYTKIDVNKQNNKRIQELENIGWELFSVRSGNDGNIYAIFRRPK